MAVEEAEARVHEAHEAFLAATTVSARWARLCVLARVLACLHACVRVHAPTHWDAVCY